MAVETQHKYLICPECAKEGQFVEMRVYRTVNPSVYLEWAADGAVYRTPSGDSSDFSVYFGEIEGHEADADQIDGDYAECFECDHCIPLSEALSDEALYVDEETFHSKRDQ